MNHHSRYSPESWEGIEPVCDYFVMFGAQYWIRTSRQLVLSELGIPTPFTWALIWQRIIESNYHHISAMGRFSRPLVHHGPYTLFGSEQWKRTTTPFRVNSLSRRFQNLSGLFTICLVGRPGFEPGNRLVKSQMLYPV